MYLLVRTYKDGKIWSTVGTKERIENLHSYCTGIAYSDEIYLVQTGSIKKLY